MPWTFREKYARLWFDGLAKFHRIKSPEVWEFDESHVRAFLRSKLEKGMPTWKRIKIVEGLIWYRNRVRESTTPRLESLRAKLQETLVEEKLSKDEEPIEGIVGKIDPRDPDIIQQMRRALRLIGRTFNTEKAYVGKVIAFMKAGTEPAVLTKPLRLMQRFKIALSLLLPIFRLHRGDRRDDGFENYHDLQPRDNSSLDLG